MALRVRRYGLDCVVQSLADLQERNMEMNRFTAGLLAMITGVAFLATPIATLAEHIPIHEET